MQNSLKSIRVALKITRITAGLPLALTLGSDIRNESTINHNKSTGKGNSFGVHGGGGTVLIIFGIDESRSKLSNRNRM